MQLRCFVLNVILSSKSPEVHCNSISDIVLCTVRIMECLRERCLNPYNVRSSPDPSRNVILFDVKKSLSSENFDLWLNGVWYNADRIPRSIQNFVLLKTDLKRVLSFLSVPTKEINTIRMYIFFSFCFNELCISINFELLFDFAKFFCLEMSCFSGAPLQISSESKHDIFVCLSIFF